MSSRTRIAVGLASGYLLGRYRKTRWLAMIAAAVAARQLGGAAARQGASALGSSPELKQLGEQGREAAVAVLSNQLTGISRRLHERTEALREPLSAAPDGEQEGEQDGQQEAEHDSQQEGEQDSQQGGQQEGEQEGEQEQDQHGSQREQSDQSAGDSGDGDPRAERGGQAPEGERDRVRVGGRPGAARGRR